MILHPAPYLVGENGPELVVPAAKGKVVDPASGNVTISVVVKPAFTEAMRQTGMQVAWAVHRALRAQPR